MLDISELNSMKIRMLVAGEVAQLIVTQQEGEPLNISADKYDLVVESLEKLDSDVRSVLSELDVLRGYVTGSFNLLEGKSHGCDSDVEGTRPQESVGSSEGERTDSASTSGTAGSSGADGKKPRRSKPRRNRRSSKKDQGNVEREDTSEAVDSSTK